jgi:hypothetical protein
MPKSKQRRLIATPSDLPRDLRPAAKAALEQGWTIQFTRGNHLRWMPPDPTVGFVTSGQTVSDRCSIKNMTARLRRHGLDI